MAPSRASGARRSTQANEHIYRLGERGRKTGVTLRDTGVRDEHGMEPIDDIFSSPTRSRAGDGSGSGEEDEEDEEDYSDGNGEADMDLTTGSGLDPAALIYGQRSAARFGARQQQQQQQNTLHSPAKSLYGSPAVRGSASKAAMRQNPLLRPPSSPENVQSYHTSSPTKPVKRRLDFGKNASASSQHRPFALTASNGTVLKPRSSHPSRHVQEEEEEEDETNDDENYSHENSMHMVGDSAAYNNDQGPQDFDAAEEEEDDDDEPIPPPKRKAIRPSGKAKTTATSRTLPPGPQQYSSPAVSKGAKRARPAENTGSNGKQRGAYNDDEEREQQHAKRQRLADEPKSKPKPRSRLPSSAKPPAPAEEEPEQDPGDSDEPAASKKAARKRKSSGVGAATAAAAAVPRGPPLPKSRGLVVRRREWSEDANTVMKTRSGRTSYRPLAFWRNEHVEMDPSTVQYDGPAGKKRGDHHFILPSVKEIVRVEDEILEIKQKGSSRARDGAGDSKRSRRRPRQDDDDEGGENEPEREPWETESGKVSGDIVVWYPEYEVDAPAPGQEVEMTTAEIALSDAAIQTHEVRGGTFRFVKTLSLPFFGTGMVDMPPGAEKRLKNSRKMHMTFFVHYGQVLVRVNDTEFQISKGGMWSVPRGNYYSINNETDYPARVFFAQGCEILTTLEEAGAEDEGEGEGDGDEN